jgi:hypothetical protein
MLESEVEQHAGVARYRPDVVSGFTQCAVGMETDGDRELLFPEP